MHLPSRPLSTRRCYSFQNSAAQWHCQLLPWLRLADTIPQPALQIGAREGQPFLPREGGRLHRHTQDAQQQNGKTVQAERMGQQPRDRMLLSFLIMVGVYEASARPTIRFKASNNIFQDKKGLWHLQQAYIELYRHEHLYVRCKSVSYCLYCYKFSFA